MISVVLVLLLTLGISIFVIDNSGGLRTSEKRLLKGLYLYHLAFGFLYYIYVQFNPSDSDNYYYNPLNNLRGEEWFDYLAPGTPFVEFVAWPFVKLFGFSYEAMMVLFCFLGFFGFYFFYLFIKERIRFKHKFFGYDLLTIILFLPNMHFWTVSLGKGSLIFFGIGMFVWAANKFRTRLIPLVIGAFIVYGVRVPILLVLVLGAGMGLVMSSKGLSTSQKVFGIIIAAGGIVYVSQLTSSFLQLDQINDLTGYYDNRANELTRGSGSAVNIGSYNLVQKVFTFVYRPLFVDGVNAMGMVVSFENLFYLILTFKLLSGKGLRFLWKSDYMVKMCLAAFIGASVALAQIAGNLGIAIRQKSQIMYLFLFVVLQFLDDEKLKKYIRQKRRLAIQKKRELYKKAA